MDSGNAGTACAWVRPGRLSGGLAVWIPAAACPRRLLSGAGMTKHSHVPHQPVIPAHAGIQAGRAGQPATGACFIRQGACRPGEGTQAQAQGWRVRTGNLRLHRVRHSPAARCRFCLCRVRAKPSTRRKRFRRGPCDATGRCRSAGAGACGSPPRSSAQSASSHARSTGPTGSCPRSRGCGW